MEKIPLFPLHTVLYPSGILPLRIFEIRYIDMIGECLRKQQGFGVNLIRAGREAGQAARCFDVGTYAEIIDWNRQEDGLLGIIVRGRHRYQVQAYSVRDNNLLEGKVSRIAREPELSCSDEHEALQCLLKKVIEHYADTLPYRDELRKIEDVSWLGNRLSELLPLAPALKQELLELSDPIARLQILDKLIDRTATFFVNAG